MLFDNMKIRKRLVIGFSLLQLVMFTITVLYVANYVDKMVKDNVFAQSSQITKSGAFEVREKLNGIMTIARTAAQLFEEKGRFPSLQTRDYLDQYTKDLLRKNPELFGTWTTWEPNQVDGMDAQFSNKGGYAADGRFQVYYFRSKDGIEEIKSFDFIVDTAEHYALPKRLMKDLILNPYYDPDAKVMMTSLVSPIMIDGQFKGVFGIDITLDGLQKMIERIKPYENSYAFLVSNNGTIAAHPKAKVINKIIGDVDNAPDKDSMKTSVKNGVEFSVSKISALNGKMTEQFFYPFMVGEAEMPWSFAITIPIEELLQESYNFYLMISIVSLICIFASMIIGSFFAARMSKPIEQMADAASKIAKGDFNVSIDLNTKDESGVLAENFRMMIQSIRKISEEITSLSQAATNGKLDYRGKSDNYEGEFKDLVVGINQTLDAIIKPLNLTAEYVDRIAKGDIPPKITEEYKGDFNEIKNNLNQCIDAVTFLVIDTNALVGSATKGNLNDRADSNKHLGDFKLIVEGINNTLDRLVGLIDNLPVAVQIVDKQYDILYLNESAKKLNKKNN